MLLQKASILSVYLFVSPAYVRVMRNILDQSKLGLTDATSTEWVTAFRRNITEHEAFCLYISPCNSDSKVIRRPPIDMVKRRVAAYSAAVQVIKLKPPLVTLTKQRLVIRLKTPKEVVWWRGEVLVPR